MNTVTSKPKDRWLRILIFGLEAYLVFVSFVLMVWHFNGLQRDSAVGWMFCGIILSIFGLLIAGFILVFRRQPKWGWTTLAFVGLWSLYFVLIVLPIIVKASGY
jgi:hypothetical protein